MLSYFSSAKPGGLTIPAWQPAHASADVCAVTMSRLVLPVAGSGVLAAPGGGAGIWRQSTCFSRNAPRRIGDVRLYDEYDARKPACVNTPARCEESRLVSV